MAQFLLYSPYWKNVSKNEIHLLKQGICLDQTQHRTQKTYLSAILFDICDAQTTLYIHITAGIQNLH